MFLEEPIILNTFRDDEGEDDDEEAESESEEPAADE